jgi:protein MpaA
VIVVGCIHGTEPEGRKVVADLAGMRPPPGVQLWLVATVNPDGLKHGTRGNAHGVDLNRNWPYDWRHLSAGYYSGPRPLSEPETRAARKLIRDVHPALTVWYHQPFGLVDSHPSAGRALVRLYSRSTGLPLRDLGSLHGAATRWQHARLGSDAFVVELPPGRLSAAAARRHARALVDVAARLPLG